MQEEILIDLKYELHVKEGYLLSVQKRFLYKR